MVSQAKIKAKFVSIEFGPRGDFARELMDHTAQDHKEVGTVKCPICGQESSLENLENHYRNCVKVKYKQQAKYDRCDQVCPTCGKNFKSKSNYRSHLRKHLPKEDRKNGEESERPFCDQGGNSIENFRPEFRLEKTD